MRETITANRITICPVIGKQVAQQISAYSLQEDGSTARQEILTKYCSGEVICKSTDCQFVVGLKGKIYTDPIDTIYKGFVK
ncbi:MAG: hypothetical protein ABFC84_13900 [Veillonellales bacterium]